jgi:hypothetical protein
MSSSQGPNNPASAATGGGWSTINNAFASDNAYAQGQALANAVSPITNLRVTNFGFSVPSGATIDGVVCEIERKINSTFRNSRDGVVQLTKNGTNTVGSNKASATVWPLSDAYATYGAAADLWGTTWTDSDINASTFGVVINGVRDSGKAGSTIWNVDHVRITVYYTAAGGGGRLSLSNCLSGLGGAGQQCFNPQLD